MMAVALLVCAALSAAIAVAAAAAGGGSVKVKSAPFSSALGRVVWAGSSGFDCDQKCRSSCSSVGHEHLAQWGDAAGLHTDACVAGCGCGGGSDHIFASTDEGDVYVSMNAGQDWSDLHKQIPGYPQKGEPYRILEVHASTADPRSVVLLTNTTASWISHDGGGSWHALRLSTHANGERRITAWKWHPSRREWALVESYGPAEVTVAAAPGASAHTAGSGGIVASAVSAVFAKGKRGGGGGGGRAAAVGTTSRLAFYTQDGGVTFKPLAEDVAQCHWAVRPGDDERRVVLAREVRGDGGQRGGGGASAVRGEEVLVSTDFMATHTTLLGRGGGGGGSGPLVARRVLFHYNFIFAVVPELTADGEPNFHGLQLWFASAPSERQQTAPRFRAAKWPRGAAPRSPRQLLGIQVLHSAENLAMIFVPAGDPSLPWGHVYSCGYDSLDMELVLTEVFVTGGGRKTVVHWQAVSGIDGIFLANRMVPEDGQNLDKAVPTGRVGDTRGDTDSEDDDAGWEANKAEEVAKPRNIVQTYISLDMGSAWQPLRAPEKTPSGEALPGCVGKNGQPSRSCRLHLKRWTSSFAAPGVIIGVGNAGVRLSKDSAHHDLFVSRDAGLIWSRALEGPHEFAILSHGDAFVAVSASDPGTALYSTDGGRQWQSTVVAAASKGFSVQGVFTHPSHTDWRAFFAFGNDANLGIAMATLDFSDVLKDVCKGADAAGSSGSDFEKWSPSDSLEDAHDSKRPVCLLGVKSHYTRRLPDRQCKTGTQRFAPLDHRSDTPCECTAMDWACDVGFHRAAYLKGAPCEPLDGESWPNVTKLCAATTDKHIEVTRGYRKVPGDRCAGGTDLSPTHEQCPGNQGLIAAIRNFFKQRTPVWMVFFTVLLLALFAVQRQAFMGKHDFRKKYEDACSPHDDDEECARLLLDRDR